MAKKDESATEQATTVGEPVEPGPAGYAEPRPEQKSGEGRDAGQELADARDELNEQERKRQEK